MKTMHTTKIESTATLKTEPGQSLRSKSTRFAPLPRTKLAIKRWHGRPTALSWALVSLVSASVASTGFTALFNAAHANPKGPTVVNGNATFTNEGNKLIIRNTDGTVINWQSFNIQPNEQTHFQQNSASSTVINRVIGNDPSKILGLLTSNGRVVLVNPFGITVGRGASVDTAGFTASALNITEADAKAGRMRFQGNALNGSAGAIQVDGMVRTQNGDILLFAPNITVGVDGLVRADNGNVILGAGQKVEITGRGLEGIKFEVQSASDRVTNLGQLQGNAVGVFAGAIKHSGAIVAQTATMEGGKIVLRAVKNVEIAVASKLIADGSMNPVTNSQNAIKTGSAGGQISISSAQGDVSVGAGALISAKGIQASGGQVTIQAEQGNVVVQPFAQLSVDGGVGGSVRVIAAQQSSVAGVINARGTADLMGLQGLAQAQSGAGGGALEATSGGAASSPALAEVSGIGGQIDVLGQTVSVDTGAVLDVSGDLGGGKIRIGGDFQGKDTNVQNALDTNVSAGVLLLANAKVRGNGGEVIVWSDDTTRFSGSIEAQGGEFGGNGGFGETSGHKTLYFRGRADMSARRGRTGSLLLDPSDATLAGGANLGAPNTFYEADIEAMAGGFTLSASNSITTLTGTTFTSGINITPSFAGFSLDVQAGGTGNIDLNTSVSTNDGAISIVNNGSGAVNLQNGRVLRTSATIAMGGAPITVSSNSDLNIGGSVLAGASVVSLSAGVVAGNSSLTINGGAQIAASGIEIVSNRINITGGGTTISVADGGSATLRPMNPTRDIVLGANDAFATGFLGIDSGEIAKILLGTNSVLRIGSQTAYDGTISINAAGIDLANRNTSFLTANAGKITDGGSITNGLYLRAESGVVDLGNNTHSVASLSGRSLTGDFNYRSAGNLQLVQFDGANGITSNGAIKLKGPGATSTLQLQHNGDLTSEGDILIESFGKIEVQAPTARIDSNGDNFGASGRIRIDAVTVIHGNAVGGSKNLILDSSSSDAAGAEIRLGGVNQGPGVKLTSLTVNSSGSTPATAGEIILDGSQIQTEISGGSSVTLTGKVRLNNTLAIHGQSVTLNGEVQPFGGTLATGLTLTGNSIYLNGPIGTGTPIGFLNATAGQVSVKDSISTSNGLALHSTSGPLLLDTGIHTLNAGVGSISSSSSSIITNGSWQFNSAVNAPSASLILANPIQTTTFLGNATLGGGLGLNANAFINIASGKTLSVGTSTLSTRSLTLNGDGTLQVNGALLATSGANLVMTNAATGLTVNGGSFTVNGGAFLRAQGTISVTSGNTMFVTGGNLGVADYGVTGTLTVNAPLVVGGGSYVEVDWGPTPSASDRLNVNGSLSFVSGMSTLSVAEVGGTHINSASTLDVIGFSAASSIPLMNASVTDISGINSTVTNFTNGVLRLFPIGVTTRWNTDTSGQWDVPANWTRGVPNISTGALIDRAVANPVVTIGVGVSANAASLSFGAGSDSLKIDGGRLFTGSSSINVLSGSTLGISENGGTLAGAGALNVLSSATFLLNGGTLSMNGGVTTSAGSTTEIKTANLMSNWSNDGQVELHGGAALTMAPNVVFTNQPGGTFVHQSGSSTLSLGLGAQFDNAGVLSVQTGATGLLVTGSGQLQNRGTVDVSGGAELLIAVNSPGAADTGLYNSNFGSTLSFSGSRTLGIGSDIGGVGAIRIYPTGTLVVNDNLSAQLTGEFAVGGTLSLNTSKQVIFANSLQMQGVNARIDGVDDIETQGGLLIGGGTLAGSGSLDTTAGVSILGAATVARSWQNSGSIVLAQAASQLTLAGDLHNTGTVVITDGTTTPLVLGSSTLTNDGILTWSVGGDKTISGGAGSSLINTAGGVYFAGYSHAVTTDQFTQAGALNIDNGVTFSRAAGFTNTGTIRQSGDFPGSTYTINVGSSTLVNGAAGVIEAIGDGVTSQVKIIGNLDASNSSGELKFLLDPVSSSKITVTGNFKPGNAIEVLESTPFVGSDDNFTLIVAGTASPVGMAGAPIVGSSIAGVSFESSTSVTTLSVFTTSVSNSWATSVNGNWTDDSKWSRGHAPRAGESATISPSGSHVVTLTSGNATALNLQMGNVDDGLKIAGGTLTLAGSSTIEGTLDLGGGRISLTGGTNNLKVTSLSITSGSIDGTGDLVIQSGGGMNWSGGTISGSGKVSLYSDSFIGGNGPVLDGRELCTHPGMTLGIGSASTNAFLFQLQNGGRVRNMGNLYFDTSGTEVGGVAGDGTGAVINEAGLVVAAQPGQSVGFFNTELRNNSGGTINVVSGTARTSMSSNWGVGSSTLSIAAGAGFELQGGSSQSLVFGPNMSLANAGSLTVSGGSTLTANGGASHDAGSTINVSAGKLILLAAENFAGLNVGLLGTVQSDSSISVAGTMSWGGLISNDVGTLTPLSTTGVVNITGPAIANRLNWLAAGNINYLNGGVAGLRLNAMSTLTIANTSTLSLRSTSVSLIEGNGKLINNGVIVNAYNDPSVLGQTASILRPDTFVNNGRVINDTEVPGLKALLIETNVGSPVTDLGTYVVASGTGLVFAGNGSRTLGLVSQLDWGGTIGVATGSTLVSQASVVGASSVRSLLLDGGATMSHNAALTVSKLNISSGNWVSPAPLYATNQFTLTGGSIAGIGGVTIGSAVGAGIITGGSIDGSRLVNLGTASIGNSALFLGSSGIFDNQVEATLSITSASGGIFGLAGSTLQNNGGFIDFSPLGGSLSFNGSVTNSGMLKIAGNNVTFGSLTMGSGTINTALGARLNLGNTAFSLGGTLQGLGTLAINGGVGTLDLGATGVLSPGGVGAIGTLTVQGDAVLDMGTLNFELSTPSSHDVLRVTGTVTSCGCLTVDRTDLLATYSPGANFDVLQASGGLVQTATPVVPGFATAWLTGPNRLRLTAVAGDNYWNLQSGTVYTSGNWSVGSNWSLGLPTAAQQVYIDRPDPLTVTVNSLGNVAGGVVLGTNNTLSVASGGGLTIDGSKTTAIAGSLQIQGTLNLQANATLGGAVALATGGRLIAQSSLTLAGAASVDGGTIATSGGLTTLGTVTLGGAAKLDGGGNWTNSGTIRVTPGSSFSVGGELSLNNAGLLEFLPSAALASTWASTIHNTGTIAVSGVAGATLNTSGVDSGLWQVASGSTLSLRNASRTLATGFNATGTGLIRLDNAGLVLSTHLSLSSGGPALMLDGASISGTQNLTVGSSLMLTNAGFDGGGTLFTPSGSVVSFTGDAQPVVFSNNSKWINNGQVNFTVATSLLTVASGSNVINGLGGSWVIGTGNQLDLFGVGTLSNLGGTISVGSDAFMSVHSVPLVQQGVVDLGANAIFARPVSMVNEGTIRGNGSIQTAAFTNASTGTLAPGSSTSIGSINFSGSADLTAGTIKIKLSGVTNHDVVTADAISVGLATVIDRTDLFATYAPGATFDVLRSSIALVGTAPTVAGFIVGFVATPGSGLRLTAQGGDNVWTNLGSGSWESSGNWSAGATPTAAQQVIINQPAALTVSVNSPGQVAGGVILGTANTLALSGGALTIDGSKVTQLDGSVLINGGQINLPSNASVNGAVALQSGSLRSLGALSLAGQLSLTGSGTLAATGGVTTTGLVNTSGGSTIDAPTWTQRGTLQGTGSINLNGGTLVNEGVISPGGAGAIGALLISGNLNLTQGTVKVELTNISTHDVLGVSGAVATGTTTVIDRTDLFATYAPGASFDVIRGGVALSGAAPTVGGFNVSQVTTPGFGLRLTAQGGDNVWTNLGSGSWEASSNWSAGATPTAAQQVVINRASPLTVTVSLPGQVAGGVILGSANTLALNGGALDIDGSKVTQLNGTVLINGGELNAPSGASFAGGVVLQSGSLRSSGALALSGALNLSSSGSLSIGGGLTTSGLVTIDGVARVSTPTWIQRGTVQGTGSIDLNGGTLINEGVLSPGGSGVIGTLSVRGNLQLAGASSTVIDLGSSDQVTVSGLLTVEAGATLSVSELAPNRVKTDSVYSLFSAGTLSGSSPVIVSGISDVRGFSSTLTSGNALQISPTGVTTSWNTDANGSWATAANWTRGAPVSSSVAVIDRTSANPVVSVSANAAVGSLTVVGGDVLSVESGSTFAIGAAANINNLTVSGAVTGAAITSGGQVRLNDGAVISSALNTTGVLTVTGATRLAGGGSANSGVVSIGSGVLDISGGAYSLNSASVTSAGGTIVVSGGVLDINGASSIGGNVSAVLTAGSFNANNAAGIDLNTFDQRGGVLGGSADVRVSGAYQVSGGDQSGSGATRINGATGNQISGGAINRSQRIANNAALLMSGTIGGNGEINNSGSIQFQGVVSNLSLVSAGQVDVRGSGAQFNGGVNLAGGQTTLASGARFGGASGLSLGSGAILSNSGASTLDGGAVGVSVQGTLSPGGASAIGEIAVNGNLVLGGSAVLAIELQNTSSHDRITVSGPASVGGRLQLSDVAGANYVAGNVFSVISAGGAVQGNFETISPGRSFSGKAVGSSFQLSALAQESGWTGVAGDNNWFNPLNWDSGHVPMAAETASIDKGGAFSVDISSGPAFAGGVVLGSNDRLNVNGQVLNVSGQTATRIDGTLSVNGGGSVAWAAGLGGGSGLIVLNNGGVNFAGGTYSFGSVSGLGSLGIAGGDQTIGSIQVNNLTQTGGSLRSTSAMVSQGYSQLGGVANFGTANLTQQNGAMRLGLMNVSGGLDLVADDIEVASTLTAAIVRVRSQTAGRAISLGASQAGALSLDSSELSRLQTGVLSVGNASGGDVTISGAVDRGTGALLIGSGGVVSQSSAGAITAANFAVAASSVLLDSAENDFGIVAATSAGALSLRDRNALSIGSVGVASQSLTGLTAGGELRLTAGGPVTQSAAIAAAGGLRLSGAGGFGLGNAGNQMGGPVSLINVGATTLASAGLITVQGSATSLNLTARDVSLGSLSVGGPLTINASARINQGASIAIAGVSNFTANDISLSLASAYGGAVTVNAIGAASLNSGGALAVQGQGGSVTLTSAGAITQSGALLAPSVVVNAIGQRVNLSHSGNRFGSLVFNVADISARTSNATLVVAGAASNSAELTFASSLSQSAALATPRLSVVALAPAGVVLLDGGNSISTVSFSNAGGAYDNITYRTNAANAAIDGAVSATRAVSIDATNSGLAMSSVSASTVSVQSSGALTQQSDSSLTAANAKLQGSSVGAASQSFNLSGVGRVQLIATAGDVNATSNRALTLTGDNRATGAFSVTSAGLTMADARLRASTASLASGSGDLSLISQTSAVLIDAGNVSLQGARVVLQAGSGSVDVNAFNQIKVTAAGDIVINGGSGSGAHAALTSDGPSTITAGGALLVTAGSGANAYAKVDPLAGQALEITAPRVTLTGGSGAGAYAAIASEGNVTINSPSVVLAAGSGGNADAVIVSYFGKVVAPGCINCVQLTSSPLSSSATQTGILQGPEFLAILLQQITSPQASQQFAQIIKDAGTKPTTSAKDDEDAKKRKKEGDIVVTDTCPS